MIILTKSKSILNHGSFVFEHRERLVLLDLLDLLVPVDHL